jgi:FKBP-type peptidyl-prolyl cis-trans isomerase SlyD
MTISNNKVVSLSYVLRVDDQNGEVIETVEASRPLRFIFGTGQLLPKFEDHLQGLAVGASFSFRLSSADAYGNAQEEAVVTIPKSAFEVDGEVDEEMLTVGSALPMMDTQGNRLEGVIVEVRPDEVVMDFNHPLAGDDLFFTGKVEDVREASEEELTQGRGHGDSCGSGGCDGCNGGCH